VPKKNSVKVFMFFDDKDRILRRFEGFFGRAGIFRGVGGAAGRREIFARGRQILPDREKIAGPGPKTPAVSPIIFYIRVTP
jgi:hypothetical protein